MLIRPRVLSLITTRRCTAACDHCCMGSGPKASQAIPVEHMHRLIEEARRIPSMQRVVFTGGECFLLGPALNRLVAHAHRRSFHTRVVTNAFWASSDDAARRRLAPLRKAGLDEMMVSTGTFHERFVPMARVVSAARAAARAGIPTRIAVETCDQQRFDESGLVEALSGEIASGRVFIGHDPWTPDAGGRGRTALTHAALLARGGERAAFGRCAQVLDTVTVTADRQLLACCGFPMEQLPQLRIGQVSDAPLDDVLREAPNRLMQMWLHVAGPSAIAEFVARYLPGYALPPSVSLCQACAALQRDPRAMRVLAEHGREVAQSIVSSFVQAYGGLQALQSF